MKGANIVKTFTLANEFKEGDLPIGGTRDEKERGEARSEISQMTVAEVAGTVFVEDELSEALRTRLDRGLLREIARLTIGDLKQVLLSRDGPSWIERYRPGLSSEVIAGIAKIMSDEELGQVCGVMFNPLPGAGLPIGAAGHFGSRIQPNSPGDNEEEILLSILEGLSYGCGDVIIGLNPASDDVESVVRLEELLRRVVEGLTLPTRYCVLSDILKQSAAMGRTTIDVGFQSLAGTSKAIAGMVGIDVNGLLDLAGGFSGLYFETGQGSAVTNGAAEGVDMVTLESRAYGLARFLQCRTGAWMIVNDVAGFIGPEVFRTVAQLKRACLEDAMMAKLHGLTMGLDVCSTFHMGLDPATLSDLTTEVVRSAWPAYVMAVAGNADPMLGYMTTAFRDHPRLRDATGRRITSAMERRLKSLGVSDRPGERAPSISSLYAAYMRSLGDWRSADALRLEGGRKIHEMQERGYDIGYGDSLSEAGAVRLRMDAIYRNARAALYAQVDQGVIRNVCARPLWIRSTSTDREDYLAHPATGERIRPEDARQLMGLSHSRRPRLGIVISDGLNANAVNENLNEVLPGVKQGLGIADAAELDIVIANGRVRAGYHVGELTGAECVLHLIGERPGTGINTLSAYITYGFDAGGRRRWSRDLDHSATTAICGIHKAGKPPEVAVDEIVRCVNRTLETRRSGVMSLNGES